MKMISYTCLETAELAVVHLQARHINKGLHVGHDNAVVGDKLLRRCARYPAVLRSSFELCDECIGHPVFAYGMYEHIGW